MEVYSFLRKTGADLMYIDLLVYRTKSRWVKTCEIFHVRGKEEIIYLGKVGTYAG